MIFIYFILSLVFLTIKKLSFLIGDPKNELKIQQILQDDCRWMLVNFYIRDISRLNL